MDSTNISWWEFAIAVLALVGLVVTLRNVSEAMRDLMLGLTGRAEELIPVVAWNNVRGEFLMTTILSVYLIYGVMGMLTPPNPSAEGTVTAVVTSVMAIGIEILVVANSFANRWDRQLMRNPRFVMAPEPGPVGPAGEQGEPGPQGETGPAGPVARKET